MQSMMNVSNPDTLGVKRTGAQVVIACLESLGVEMVFGYPGGAILPIYDALYGSPIEHVLTKHEQGAIHAAEGYARATGGVGTVFATSGPGATNLVTGIANAFMDSTPLVVLTGQVATTLLGRDGFQEVDMVGITLPITKHSYQVRDAAHLSQVLRDAYHIATTGRPGPVLIDIPKDVMQQMVPFESLEPVTISGYTPPKYPDRLEVEAVADAIACAEKPLLYIGGGIVSSEASEELRAFVRQTGIPVVSTLMGLGAFPPDDPLFLGMLGMHGTYAANMAVQHCDLLIACGVRFDDRVTCKLELFSPQSKKVHIDIDAAEIEKNVTVEYPLLSDAKHALQALLATTKRTDCTAWVSELQAWARQYPLSYTNDETSLKAQFVIDLLDKMTNSEAIVTTDVGQHQMWAAHFYRAKKPRTFLTSGGLGTMGYGFPAAIGAQLALPDAQVVCISGDASFQMNIQELQTVSERNIPVKVFVINNHFLGMVRQWQEMFYEHRLSESDIGAPDFVRVAEAYNVKGLRAKTPEEARRVMEEALSHPGPVVVDFWVLQEENVFPMVAPGKGNHEILLKG